MIKFKINNYQFLLFDIIIIYFNNHNLDIVELDINDHIDQNK